MNDEEDRTTSTALWLERRVDEPIVGIEHLSAMLWHEEGWRAEYAAALEHIVPLVRGRAVHATTDVGFAGIVRDGRILPNASPSEYNTVRPATSNQSWASFAAANGYVSFMDPAAPEDALSHPGWTYWRPAEQAVNFPGKKNVAFLLLLRPAAESVLIHREYHDVFSNEPVGKHFCMPGECWYPGPVPIEEIERVVEIEWRSMREPIFARVLADVLRKRGLTPSEET